jgi:hypothetical protein
MLISELFLSKDLPNELLEFKFDLKISSTSFKELSLFKVLLFFD